VSDRPFATLVLDPTGAAPGMVEETRASVRDQGSVGVELLERTGAEGFRGALAESAGGFVGVIAPGEALVPGALAALASAADADTGLVYGDEVVLLGPGAGVELSARPTWSPERLLGHDWLGHPVLFRTELAVAACGPAPLGPAWEHDLALRVGALASSATRVSQPLLRRPGREPPSAVDTAETVRSHLARSGVLAQVEPGALPGTCRVLRDVPADLSVAVVVACQGARGLAWGERRWFAVEAIRSILRRGGHGNLEVVVAHQRGLAQTVLDQLQGLDERVRLVPAADATTRAEMVNRAALTSPADVLVLLDEHAEVAADGFVPALVGPLLDPGVGVTGARVLGPDRHLRQAGYALHQHRFEAMFPNVPSSAAGPAGVLTIPHEVSALGGGALALRRETFDDVGGLRQQLHALSGIDLSHKVRHAGLRRVWTPLATLYDLTTPDKDVVGGQRRERRDLRTRWRAPDLDEYAPAFGAWAAERDRRRAGELSGR
jgi:hypothetical protein